MEKRKTNVVVNKVTHAKEFHQTYEGEIHPTTNIEHVDNYAVYLMSDDFMDLGLDEKIGSLINIYREMSDLPGIIQDSYNGANSEEFEELQEKFNKLRDEAFQVVAKNMSRNQRVERVVASEQARIALDKKDNDELRTEYEKNQKLREDLHKAYMELASKEKNFERIRYHKAAIEIYPELSYLPYLYIAITLRTIHKDRFSAELWALASLSTPHGEIDTADVVLEKVLQDHETAKELYAEAKQELKELKYHKHKTPKDLKEFIKISKKLKRAEELDLLEIDSDVTEGDIGKQRYLLSKRFYTALKPIAKDVYDKWDELEMEQEWVKDREVELTERSELLNNLEKKLKEEVSERSKRRFVIGSAITGGITSSIEPINNFLESILLYGDIDPLTTSIGVVVGGLLSYLLTKLVR